MLRFLADNPFNIKAQDIGIPTSTATVGDALTNTVKLIMSVVGSLAIIMLIVGAIQMAASAGDPKRFALGKDTVLYASVGLIIAIAAFAIVTFISGAPLRK